VRLIGALAGDKLLHERSLIRCSRFGSNARTWSGESQGSVKAAESGWLGPGQAAGQPPPFSPSNQAWNDDGRRQTGEDLDIGTYRSILKQAGLWPILK
jgi:hypothetical protein